MNIEILQEHIDSFNLAIVDSGFKRDLTDFISSLPAAQNNIVTLRDIAGKVLTVLKNIYAGDLPDSLGILLPREQVRPFTEYSHDEKLIELIEDTEIQQSDFFNQFGQFLNRLNQQIDQNIKEINNIQQFIEPYISKEVQCLAAKNQAIIAIVFKERETVTNLRQFTKTLSHWNKILPVYHQLLKSESPEDVQIVEIQNGSIDVAVNLNIDVAINLVELFKLGFTVFGAYLTYKKMIKPIIDAYYGNQDLISSETTREKKLLENIGLSIRKKIEEQHEIAKKKDKKIDGSSIPTKVEQISKLIASHIIKGNDFKLLAVPQTELLEDQDDKYSLEKQALRDISTDTRKQLRSIAPEDSQKLLGTYGHIKEDETD